MDFILCDINSVVLLSSLSSSTNWLLKTLIVLLEYNIINSSFAEYSWLPCNKDFSIKLDEELRKKFKNTFEFSKHDTNKFVFLLRKGIYLRKYLNDCAKFNKKNCLKEGILQQPKPRTHLRKRLDHG